MANVGYNIAVAVIRQYQTKPPVDVMLIAEHLGIKVLEKPLPDNVSGALSRDNLQGGKSGYLIIINLNHHLNRKRFTLAHEIAHYALHRDLLENGIVIDDKLYRSDLSDKYEAQANKMAANILMPGHLIRELMNRGIRGTEELAHEFGVSAEAMRIRLGRTDGNHEVEDEPDEGMNPDEDLHY